MRHFEHKNDIIVNLTFLYGKLLFLYQFLITYISETMLRILWKFATFKVAVSIINFDKLSYRYDDLYLDVTFWE